MLETPAHTQQWAARAAASPHSSHKQSPRGTAQDVRASIPITTLAHLYQLRGPLLPTQIYFQLANGDPVAAQEMGVEAKQVRCTPGGCMHMTRNDPRSYASTSI